MTGVLLVSSHARAGGAEHYVEVLADALGGREIDRIVALEEGPLVERLETGGHRVEVIQTGPGALHVLGAAWALRRAIRRSRPSAIHASGVKAALVSATATIALDVPLVWTKHDFSFDGRLVRAIGARCDAIIAVSEAVAEVFPPRTRRRVTVIYNGISSVEVDREAAAATLRQRLPTAFASSAIIALVARLDPRKGHEEVLDAAPRVLELAPAAAWVLVGPDDPAFPSYRDTLLKRIQALGLKERVAVLPPTRDPLGLIAGCDLLVIPSVLDRHGFGREAGPYVALEALAVGTPVVAYAHGGPPEVVGGCGVLVAPGDRQELAQALAGLVTDRARWAELSVCGKSRARSHFTLERMIDETTDVYRRLRVESQDRPSLRSELTIP